MNVLVNFNLFHFLFFSNVPFKNHGFLFFFSFLFLAAVVCDLGYSQQLLKQQMCR